MPSTTTQDTQPKTAPVSSFTITAIAEDVTAIPLSTGGRLLELGLGGLTDRYGHDMRIPVSIEGYDAKQFIDKVTEGERVTVLGQPTGFRSKDDEWYLSLTMGGPGIDVPWQGVPEHTAFHNEVSLYGTLVDDAPGGGLRKLRTHWLYELHVSARQRGREVLIPFRIWDDAGEEFKEQVEHGTPVALHGSAGGWQSEHAERPRWWPHIDIGEGTWEILDLADLRLEPEPEPKPEGDGESEERERPPQPQEDIDF